MFKQLLDRLETSEELGHGQVVIIAARWILVIAGLMLALWNPEALGELRTQVVLILGLAVGNFFLHSQLLMKKPIALPIVYGASAADIGVVSLIIAVAGGFSSSLFVFYFPALLAMSVAFRTSVSLSFAAAAIMIYALISGATMAESDGAVLVTRMLMLAGVAVCGNAYWRTERDRRNAAANPLGVQEPSPVSRS